MSYQVLARKWRPRKFSELVGQEHVVRALTNALDTGRMHHAYLFTGTRGVGKTTIARIFAKSLNCERGQSADPCGECSVCTAVDEGRFVDLLEIDAASNTGVDDVREVIENAQYAPSRGRFKVYLVDEVHMLSKNAFNALLKTLEEPPPHVKFLLATTDPQKLPVTVLSRCLKFNLKRLLPEQISGQMRHILGAENIAYEDSAIGELARAADGSLRDGLSLLDQAIAYGGGALHADDVRTMLGSVARGQVLGVLEALASGDGEQLLVECTQIASYSPDFGGVLDDIAGLLHRLQLIQLIPGYRPEADGRRRAGRPRRAHHAGGRAAVLPDCSDGPARPHAGARRPHRFRDGLAAHARFPSGRRTRGGARGAACADEPGARACTRTAVRRCSRCHADTRASTARASRAGSGARADCTRCERPAGLGGADRTGPAARAVQRGGAERGAARA